MSNFVKSASALCLLCALTKLLFAATDELSSAPPVSIFWHTNSSTVELRLDDTALKTLKERKPSERDWPQLFPVTVEQENIRAQLTVPPLAGSYTLTGSGLEFRPAFPFDPGVRYRANFNAATLGAGSTHPVTSLFSFLPVQKDPTTFVTEVYPTVDVLPENLLKFYLSFSSPMSRGHIYEHIHLLNEKGAQVELPFLEIDEELWSPDMTRLTLFLDPGRIKRGVRPLEEVGPALLSNQNYTFVIDSGWRDAAGMPLKSKFEKRFRVTPPDREPPNPKKWRIEPPSAGSRTPLQVTFSKPMDHALALRMITISDPNQKVLSGRAALTQHETVWSFIPTEPWPNGSYELKIQSTIEDLAGNNIGRPFEVDLAEETEPRPLPKSVSCPFQIH